MPVLPSLKVVVVDDDDDVRDLLVTYLGSQGMSVFEARNEAELLDCVAAQGPDVVLLDVNLGSEDGFAIARRLRGSDWRGGLVMVTGRGDTIDRVVGLEIGADDYVAKPFELRELLARIRSVSRRLTVVTPVPSVPTTAISQSPALRFADFVLDREQRTLVRSDGTPIPLTTGEFSLLVALAEHPGRVLSRDDLLQRTHHRDAGPFDRTVDVQIGRLRKKLGDDGTNPKLIKSVRGVGYVLTGVH